MGSVLMSHRLSCSEAHAILPELNSRVSCIGRQISNHWTYKGSPQPFQVIQKSVTFEGHTEMNSPQRKPTHGLVPGPPIPGEQKESFLQHTEWDILPLKVTIKLFLSVTQMDGETGYSAQEHGLWIWAELIQILICSLLPAWDLRLSHSKP